MIAYWDLLSFCCGHYPLLPASTCVYTPFQNSTEVCKYAIEFPKTYAVILAPVQAWNQMPTKSLMLCDARERAVV